MLSWARHVGKEHEFVVVIQKFESKKKKHVLDWVAKRGEISTNNMKTS